MREQHKFTSVLFGVTAAFFVMLLIAYAGAYFALGRYDDPDENDPRRFPYGTTMLYGPERTFPSFACAQTFAPLLWIESKIRGEEVKALPGR